MAQKPATNEEAATLAEAVLLARRELRRTIHDAVTTKSANVDLLADTLARIDDNLGISNERLTELVMAVRAPQS